MCVHTHTLQVSEAALLQGLANRALELEAKREQSKPAAAAGAGAAAAAVRTANKRWHMGELLELLPCLAEGLDVNVRFDGCVGVGSPSTDPAVVESGASHRIPMTLNPPYQTNQHTTKHKHSADAFESTAALTAFDALGVRLLHGWLLDPRDRRTVRCALLKPWQGLE